MADLFDEFQIGQPEQPQANSGDLLDEFGIAPPKPESQGITGTLWQGAKSAGRAIGATLDTYTGNGDAVVEKAQAQQQAPKDARLQNFYDDVQRNKEDDPEDAGLREGIKNVGGAIADNKAGAGLAVVEQVPNSVPTLAGGWAGMKAGAKVGNKVGGARGAVVGGIVGGLTGMFAGNTAIETGHKAMATADDGEFTPDEQAQVTREGAIKGGVITAIDGLTLGLGGKIATAMHRTGTAAVEAATRKVLLDNGVDVANEAAVLAARSNPEISAAVRAAQESAVKVTDTFKRRATEAGTLMGMETVGEGLGEYLGELAATGKADVTDAVMEAAMSLGQSGIETAWNMSRSRGQHATWDVAQEAPDAGLADAVPQAESAFGDAVEPESPVIVPPVSGMAPPSVPAQYRTERPYPPKPSEQMGLNPNAGALSAAAAIAVDTGASPAVVVAEQPAEQPVRGSLKLAADLAGQTGQAEAAPAWAQDWQESLEQQAPEVNQQTGEIAKAADDLLATDPAADLQDRLSHIQKQAKATGWNADLIAQRDKLKSELDALPSSGDQPAVKDANIERQREDKRLLARPSAQMVEEAAALGVQDADKYRNVQALEFAMAEARKAPTPQQPADQATVSPETVTAPAAAEASIQAVIAKQIPEMSDAEIEQAIAHYGPDHKRTAKLQKEQAKRTNQGTENVPQTAQAVEAGPQPAQVAGQAPAAAGQDTAAGSEPAGKPANVKDAISSIREAKQQAKQNEASIEGRDLGEGWAEFSKDSGTVGIPRADMPQIKAEHRGAMVNFLNARGVQHEEQTVPASALKPTQAEFSREKVAKAKAFEGGNRSILISQDGHVLDGHHQWLAAREKGEDVKVIRLDAPIRDLLPMVAELPSATQDKSSAEVPAAEMAKPAAAEQPAAEKSEQAQRNPVDYLREIVRQSSVSQADTVGAARAAILNPDASEAERKALLEEVDATDAQSQAELDAALMKWWRRHFRARAEHKAKGKAAVEAFDQQRRDQEVENTLDMGRQAAAEIEKRRAKTEPKVQAPTPEQEDERKADEYAAQLRKLGDEFQGSYSGRSLAPMARAMADHAIEQGRRLTDAEIADLGKRFDVPADVVEQLTGNIFTFDAILGAAQRREPGAVALRKRQSQVSITADNPIKAEAGKPAEYGSNNKLVTADRAAELRAKLRAKLNGSQLNSGLDPEILAMGTELAIFHLEATARRFGEFARMMADDLGQPIEKIRPYLRMWYNGARDGMEDQGASIEGMDGPDEVRAALAELDGAPAGKAKVAEESDSDRVARIKATPPVDRTDADLDWYADYRQRTRAEAGANKEEAEAAAKLAATSPSLDRYVKDMAPNVAALAIKSLNKQIRIDGKAATLREHIEAWHAAGELSVSTSQEPRIKPMSRRDFNRATNAEQRMHEKRMQEAGSKTVYYVNDYDLGKTAHDYAAALLRDEIEPDQAVAAGTQAPDETTNITPELRFERLRSEGHGEMPEVLAFAKVAGATGEKPAEVYNRWQPVMGFMQAVEKGTGKDLTSLMGRALVKEPYKVESAYPGSNPPAVSDLASAQRFAERTAKAMESFNKDMALNDARTFDAERFGVDEALVKAARDAIQQMRQTAAANERAAEQLVKDAEAREKTEAEAEEQAKKDGYSAADLREFSIKPTAAQVKNWFTGTYKGKTAYSSNGHILDISGTEPHLKGWGERLDKTRTSMGEVAIDNLIHRAEKQPGVMKIEPLALNHAPELASKKHAVFSRKDGDKAVYIDLNYARYFLSKFKGAEFFAGEPSKNGDYDAIQVKHSGELVGIVMPIRMREDGRSPNEIRGYMQASGKDQVKAKSVVERAKEVKAEANGAEDPVTTRDEAEQELARQLLNAWDKQAGDTFTTNTYYPATLNLNGKTRQMAMFKKKAGGTLYVVALDTTIYGPVFTTYRVHEGKLIEDGTRNLFAHTDTSREQQVAEFKALFATAGTQQEVEDPAAAGKPESKRSVIAKAADAKAQALANYFTPGNVVASYGGNFDRVVSYQAPDKDGHWSVTVRAVAKQGGEWVDKPGERERTHMTLPDARELKKGPAFVSPSPAELKAEAQAPAIVINYGGSDQAMKLDAPAYQTTLARVEELANSLGSAKLYAAKHARLIKQAQTAGLEVPDEVLADYAGLIRPDLDDNQQDQMVDDLRNLSGAEFTQAARSWGKEVAQTAIAEAKKQNDTPAPAGSRRDPRVVSMLNPYLEGDVVSINGQDWTVRQDMPGWYLTNTGNWRGQHPSIHGIKAMADLIREVEQAATAQPADAATDFPLKEATSSYSGISHSGSSRAKADAEEYDRYIEDARASGLAVSNTDAQKEAVEKAVTELRSEYIAQYRRLMNVRAGTYSGFVAGRSNINSKQANQRNNAYDRAIEAFTTWQSANTHKARKAALDARTEAEKAADLAAAQQSRDDKEQKERDADLTLMRKILSWKKGGESVAIGKSAVLDGVNKGADGYPTSIKLKPTDGSTLTDDKFDLAALFRNRAKGESVPDSKRRVRELVDAVRAEDASQSVQEEQQEPVKADSKIPLLQAHENAMEKARDGKIDADEFRAAFAQVEQQREAILAELNSMSKDKLLRAGGVSFYHRFKTEKKDRVVDAMYRAMLDEYSLGKSYGPTSYMVSAAGMESHRQARAQALRDLVANTDAAALEQYAAEVAEARKEFAVRKEATQKALTDPQTLSEFRSAISYNAEKHNESRREAYLRLTPEQRRRYDELEAESTREAREQAKAKQRTKVASAGDTTAGEVIATKHTKHGHDLFVVKLEERVSREDYETLNNSAKRMGGSYSSYRGNGAIPGFQFRTREAAEAFRKLVAGDTTAAQEVAQARRDAFDDDRSQSAVERLRAMAAALNERADEELGRDRKVNTTRRARMASAAEAAANANKALAGTMSNIADAIESGKAKFLDLVRQKVQVEFLNAELRNAKDVQIRTKYPSYADQEKHRGQPIDDETVDYSAFPTYGGMRSDLAGIARQMVEVDGLKNLGQRLLKVADDVSDAYMEWAKNNLLSVSRFGRGDQLAEFASRDDAERAIRRANLSGRAIVLPLKRGVNRIVLSPSEAMKQGIWQGDDKRIDLSGDFGREIVEAVGRRAGSKIKLPWQLETVHLKRKRLEGMGIYTGSEYRAALREFAELQQAMATPDKIKQMERAMIGRRSDGLDFFPTSEAVVDAMLEAAEITEGMGVLEPSAGMGHIADAIREKTGVEPEVVELSGERRELLAAKGYHLAGDDFMALQPRGFYTFGDVFQAPDGTKGIMHGGAAWSGRASLHAINEDGSEGKMLGWYDRDELTGIEQRGSWSGYDRIIMNPPFSKGRDIQHVQHAYSLLKPGGRLVAIMGEGAFFQSNNAAEGFRAWLDDLGATSERLPENSFMDAALPVNTAVNARMVVIDKPATDTSGITADSARRAAVRARVAANNYSREDEDFLHGMLKALYEKTGDGVLEHKLSTWLDSRFQRLEAVDQLYAAHDKAFAGKDEVLFSRRPVKVSGATRTVLSHDAVKAIVERINARLALGTELAVYRSEAELFAAAPAIEQQAEQDGAKGEIKAVYHDGKVHVVTSAFAGNADVETAILDALAHEGQGHYGIRAMFAGNKPAIDAALREVFAAIGGVAGVKRLAAKNNIDLSSYLKTAEGMSDRQRAGYLADELLAHLQGKAATAGLTQRALNAIREYLGEIRNWLREHGFIALAKVNDADIALLLKRMREASLRNGATAPGEARFSLRRDQTATEAFRRWFGRSKVVDADGKPLVVYHGTNADFYEFRTSETGSFGSGIYFADSGSDAAATYGERVISVYLSLKNPWIVDADYESDAVYAEDVDNPAVDAVLSLENGRKILDRMKANSGEHFDAELTSSLIAKGYDGIIATYPDGSKEYVAFRPEQIKSAIGNNGDFDSWNHDIRFQRAGQTGSANFRRWFGDSKTLNKDGEPQVLYHGTAADFTVFDQTRAGSATGHSTSALGIFMSSDRRAAEQYAEKAGDGIPGYGKVMELYASIRNPYLMTVEESQEIENPLQARRLRSKLEQAGHDGIRLKGTPVWIAFNNYQVKSATDNNGEFDDFDPDIRFSRSTVRDMTSRATAELNRTFSAPGGLSWWHKTIGTMYNLAERSRHFKPVFESAQGFIDDVAYYAADAAEMAPGLLPRLETWADIAKKPITSADNKAVSKPIFEGTLMWSRDETGQPVRVDDHNDAGIVWKDAELRSMFGLNDRQIELYQEFRSATDRSLDTMARADMLRFVGEDAKAIQQEVMDAADHREAARLITEHLQQLAERSPKRFGQLMNAAQGVAERSKRISELKVKGYAPLSRFGSYTVDVVSEDGERQYFGLFETKREANQMAEQMRAEFGEGSVSQGTLSQESYKLFAGITPETLELFGGALGFNADGDKAQDQVFQEYLRLTKNNRSAMKRLMHRKGVAGYSEDVGRVLASFVYSNARQTSAGLHMGDLGKAVDAIPKAQGELKDAAVRLAEYIKNPQEEAQAVRGLLFAQYLGGSVASAFVNLTQPAAVTFPWLSQYGGASKAAAALSKAARQMATKGYQYEADLAKALHAAEEDGTVSPQEVHQLMAQARGQGSLRAGDGTRAGDARALASNSLARLSVAWGKLFGAAEQVNRRMTFIAAYRMAKEQGMGNPAAFARRAVKETQFVYTKASKMRWGRGAVGGTLMTFKTYSISYLELMGRLWTQGEKGSVQRQEGRKAVLLMLAVLLLMGGAGGLPFADDAEDLIDGLAQLAGYNFSTQKAKEAFLAEVFGEEIGRFIDKGVSGIPGAPMDVSGRLGLGNLIPGTGLFQKREDHTRDVLEIAGPMGDFAGRIVSGSRSVLEGRVGAGLLEMSPVAVRNAAKGVDMAVTGMYRDDKGYKVLDTTILEAALKSIGFQPESVAKVQEANWLNQRSKAYYNQRAQEIRALWAKGIFERDPSKIQEAREAIAEWNAQNPEQRMIINMPSVMRRAREMAKRKDERIAATAPKAMRRQMLEEIRRNQGMED